MDVLPAYRKSYMGFSDVLSDLIYDLSLRSYQGSKGQTFINWLISLLWLKVELWLVLPAYRNSYMSFSDVLSDLTYDLSLRSYQGSKGQTLIDCLISLLWLKIELWLVLPANRNSYMRFSDILSDLTYDISLRLYQGSKGQTLINCLISLLWLTVELWPVLPAYRNSYMSFSDVWSGLTCDLLLRSYQGSKGQTCVNCIYLSYACSLSINMCFQHAGSK